MTFVILNPDYALESKIGQGSTFSLHIPLKVLKNDHEDSLITPQSTSILQMLIIDDDTSLPSMLAELVKSLGITSHTFTSFSKVKTDAKLLYDLVLTDIQMPDISGFEVLKRLRSGIYKHYNKQPIIAMTGKRDLLLKNYTSNTDFNHILQKPFSKNELMSMFKLLDVKSFKIIDNELIELNIYKKECNKTYNLDNMYSFLGTNEVALYEILQTFLIETRTNMQYLEDRISAKNFGNSTRIK